VKTTKELSSIYTKKEVEVLRDLYNEVPSLDYNPMRNHLGVNGLSKPIRKLQTWYNDLSVSTNKKLADLIDGTIPYEDLPLYATVINEHYHITAKWRLIIGK
jgi:hypothetical protein